jgi:hypothetical protein
MLDKGEGCVGLFLDLTKAFDMVNHDILLQKLQFYGTVLEELHISGLFHI